MIDLPVYFEESPFDAELALLKAGDRFLASRLLTLLAAEEEDVLEDALNALEQKQILLDTADLPVSFGNGPAAVRLRREHELVKTGLDASCLEESDPLRLYLEEVAAVPAFGDENILAAELLEGKDRTEALTNLMLSLVWQRACQSTGKGVLLLDLVQEGNLGLLYGISSYAGGDFRSHCDYHISFAIAKLVTLQARQAGVGQKLRQAMEDYRAVDERLLTELGRNATLEELAEALHMTPEETRTVANMLGAARMVEKAKAPVEETPDDEQAVEDTAYFQMRQRITEMLSELEPRDARLLTLRFGLEGGRPQTPEQTGAVLGMTPEEVVAAEAAALAKLRK